jgi:proteasome accessory factor C
VDRWYLAAWCHRADDFRSFALERIRDMQLLEESALELPAEEISRHFDQAFGIFSGPAEHRARLRFNAEAARWAADEVWHPDQQGQWLDDGGAGSWPFPFGHQRELLMRYPELRSDVEVLEPDFLRQAVIAALARARSMDQYQ